MADGSYRYFAAAVAGEATHVIRRESKRELEPENYLAGLQSQIKEVDEKIAAHCDIKKNVELQQLLKEVDELIKQELKETLTWTALNKKIEDATGLDSYTNGKGSPSKLINEPNDKKHKYLNNKIAALTKDEALTYRPEQHSLAKSFFAVVVGLFIAGHVQAKIEKINALYRLRKEIKSGYFTKGNSAKARYDTFQKDYAVIYNGAAGAGRSRLNQAFMSTFLFMSCRVETLCKRVNKEFCVKLDKFREEKKNLEEKLEKSDASEVAVPMEMLSSPSK